MNQPVTDWTAPESFWTSALTATGPKDCLILANNGVRVVGALHKFDRRTKVIEVQQANSRARIELRFDQFQSLSVTAPIERRRGAPRHVAPYAIKLGRGGVVRGETAGHTESDVGLFLLPTSDVEGSSQLAVHQLFLPRTAYESFEVDPRLRTAFDDLEDEPATDIMSLVEAKPEEVSAPQESALSMNVATTPAELRAAIVRQSAMGMMRIGEALVSLGFVTEQQIDAALRNQRGATTLPLGQIMIRMGAITAKELTMALTHKMGYPIVQIDTFPIQLAAVIAVPLALATRMEIMPVIVYDNTLVVAVDDPAGRRKAMDDLSFSTKMKIVAVLAQCDNFAVAQWTAYQRLGHATEPKPQLSGEVGRSPRLAANTSKLVELVEREVVASDDAQPIDDTPAQETETALVRLINSIVIDAYDSGSSDIHIEVEPGDKKIKVRLRRGDGELHNHLELPAKVRATLVARLKIMAELDGAEKRKSQDGKINFARYSPAHKLELRVATIPTAHGLEDIVIRLLASSKPLPLDKIGLTPHNFTKMRDSIERPYGLVLCVGPTGSGKTTTLHSLISHINVPKRKIWTAEDPIEITQEGLRQVQVNPKIDWTFAKALRAFLRADPDVIMVGEIRDAETAKMAVEASLTGHLVMSTLHTNSAPETISRLLDMGLDPFNFGDSLLAIVAQRLVKRLCPDCRHGKAATADEVSEMLNDYTHSYGRAERPDPDAVLNGWRAAQGGDGPLKLYSPRGCTACDQTGYRGRVALHEVMTMSTDLRRQIQAAAAPEALHTAAVNDGMRTLRQDGIEKVLAGTANIDDVRSITNN